jgi:hypothetical protein
MAGSNREKPERRVFTCSRSPTDNPPWGLVEKGYCVVEDSLWLAQICEVAHLGMPIFHVALVLDRSKVQPDPFRYHKFPSV